MAMSTDSDNGPPARCEVASKFVDTDMAELALHMARCADERESMFGLKRRLHQSSRALAGHMVTAAFVSLSLVAVASMLT